VIGPVCPVKPVSRFDLLRITPITALPASRAYYWVEEHAPSVAHDFARAAFNAYFSEARDMTVPATVASVGASLGITAAELEAGLSSEAMKVKVKAATDEAIAKGVFGSPFFLFDGEPFWGWDRMSMLESWLGWLVSQKSDENAGTRCRLRSKAELTFCSANVCF
jgi:2-hydroxychromene-2-carboxylate isomerase